MTLKTFQITSFFCIFLMVACKEPYSPNYTTPESTLETFVYSVEEWDEVKLLNCMYNSEYESDALKMQKEQIIELYSGSQCKVINYYNNDSSAIFKVIGTEKGGSLRLDSLGNWKIFSYLNPVINPF